MCGGTEFYGLALASFGNECATTRRLAFTKTSACSKLSDVTVAGEVIFTRSIDISVRKYVGGVLKSAREHANGFPLLNYLDSLVNLYKPAESLGLAVLAFRERILQFEDPPIR